MLTLQWLRDHIKTQLGFPVVHVELDDTHLDRAICDATGEISRWLPIIVQRRLVNASPYQQLYPIEIDNVIDVIDVQFINRLQLGIADIADNPFLLEQRVIQEGTQMYPYGTFLAHRNDFRKVYSADPDWYSTWQYDQATDSRKLYLFINLPTLTPYWVGYTATMGYTADDNKEHGLPAIPQGLEQWVKDFSQAKATVTLGAIRDKFHGIPTPDQDDLQVDGGDLKREANNDVAQLLEDLKGRVRQLPPLYA